MTTFDNTNIPKLHNNPDYMDLLYDDICSGAFIWREFGRLLYRFFLFIVNLFFSLRKYIIQNETQPLQSDQTLVLSVPEKTPTEKYIDNEKARFLKFIGQIQRNTDTSEVPDTSVVNKNTDELFYEREKYREHVAVPNNELEQKWKRNILFENTPRGNIIMFYDAYKMAFSYYSNESSYPYHILNAIAMKYVRSFSCLDLFMDDSVIEFKSPLIELIQKDGKEKNENSKKGENMKIETKNNPAFAKLKNYKNGGKDGKSEKDGKDGKRNQNIMKNINKFVFLGKTDNFNILQKPPKNFTNILFSEKSRFDDIFSQETELQKQVMSYSEFKKRQQKSEKLE
jgi:hypothetical protein